MKKLLCSLAALFMLVPLFANNIQVSNVTLTGQNTTANTYLVQFDIAWQNSWRTSTFESNYDAAWIFVKFREVPATTWQHALISTTGFNAPAGSSIDVANDARGAFIFRDSDGIGDVSFTSVQLQWSYGVSFPDDQTLEICVQAIEMVYIPGGSYELGDDSNNPDGNFEAGTTTNPFTISSEASLTLGGSSSANLNNNDNTGMFVDDDFDDVTTQTLPANYPKGFDPFYVMKYEISQGQYVAFLNKIGTTGAANRWANQLANGNTIADTGVPPNIYETSTPERACNYLNWPDISAYADWAALRPMSEMEYEKCSRGTQSPAVDECAWGSPFAFNAAYTLGGAGTAAEVVTNPASGTGNALYTSTSVIINAPIRCGVFAGSIANPSRAESGGSYYGVMELSGNLWEMTVSVGSQEGRDFNGTTHGNGIISSAGNGTSGTNWPDNNNSLGVGLRGGAFTSQLDRLRISSREFANTQVANRFSDVGARLVRSNF
ncbi:MAG: SUMF1/EgtB/PvdO family nonheme iron enzyme [Bacteroidota bacterium]